MKKNIQKKLFYSDAEFLDKIQTKVLIVFSLLFTVILLCLEIFISSNSCNLLQFLQFAKIIVKEKGGKSYGTYSFIEVSGQNLESSQT